MAEDAVLAARAGQGRLDAFEELARRHYRAVYHVAFRMLGRTADAEDATQEAFERAWKGIRGFRGEAAFRTWMYRIVTNICLKKRDRARPTLPFDEALDSPEEAGTRPDRVVEEASRSAALNEAIGRLTPEQRVPLVLREFGGCSYEEIAGVTGISVQAVRGRLHRARLELMEAMRPWR